ncbi:LysR family transcriptional regulator [Asticcacaulis sp. AC466]|uniref:LysR family transcriptional regulator n=1 Tax=Asticcacaulis sp. AC466 TaxID=1282362 RepID=UPI0003C3AEC2|nr:LysR family transcriptional regulator [Asticcacaulis sp. AC466]ESQ81859.1 LysR family transcriptional regulator [Asticcacaulis sp. AC466]
MDSLSGIMAFVQAAEHLSFVAAGRALGISASAVGKSIAKLEDTVGARLLHRTTRRVSLTEEGAAFYARCRRILDDLRDAEAMVSEATGTPRGRLRVSVPTIGYRFLLPIIPAFRQRYPDIELDIDFNDRLVDVVEDGLDAVIRSGPLTDSSLMSRRLGPFCFVLCAAPAYLERHGIPQSPRDLEMHDCLRFRFPTSGKLQTWQLTQADGVDPFRRPSPLTCNNMEALRGAAISGLGIAYMPDFLAREAVDAGLLRTVLDGYLAEPGQFSILWPSNRLVSPRLRVFIDHMTETLFRKT